MVKRSTVAFGWTAAPRSGRLWRDNIRFVLHGQDSAWNNLDSRQIPSAANIQGSRYLIQRCQDPKKLVSVFYRVWYRYDLGYTPCSILILKIRDGTGPLQPWPNSSGGKSMIWRYYTEADLDSSKTNKRQYEWESSRRSTAGFPFSVHQPGVVADANPSFRCRCQYLCTWPGKHAVAVLRDQQPIEARTGQW